MFFGYMFRIVNGIRLLCLSWDDGLPKKLLEHKKGIEEEEEEEVDRICARAPSLAAAAAAAEMQNERTFY